MKVNQMRNRIFVLYLVLIILCMISVAISGCSDKETATPIPTVVTAPEEVFNETLWDHPPMDNRPYVRWWWPGGDVQEEQLKSDLELLKESGFGGVEIQPLLLGLTPEEIENNPNIRTVGTPEFFEKVRIASEEARKLGLGFDVTLGSGWSTGVLNASSAAEKQLLMSSLEMVGPAQFEGPLPMPDPPAYRERVNAIMDVVGPFDENLTLVAATAAKVIEGNPAIPVLDSFTDITAFVDKGNLFWDIPEGTWKIFAFYENNTSHAPVAAAYPGIWHDALIIDHFDSSGAQKLIENYGDPLLDALGEYAPDAVFVDSFEMVGDLPWTSSFRDQFEQAKGYDITPFLPLLFQKNGESKYTQMTDLMAGLTLTPVYTSTGEVAMRVREDYEEVRGKLFLENFVTPIIDWVHANDVELRMQAQGGWADYLDTYQLADIPESEALFAAGTFDFLKLASSGAHISGRKFVGLESFIRLSSDPQSITLEEFYRLGGKALSAGVNRIVYHGFPYSYIRESGERWYPFSAEPGTLRAGPIPFTSWISKDHPVWPDLASFNEYLARLSYAMSCGSHKADIAWLYPDWEYPDDLMNSVDECEISLALKRAGFVHDRISRQNLADAVAIGDQFEVGAAQYKGLLISDLDVATPEMMSSIENLADAGIPVIVVGDLPDRAPGFNDYEQRDMATRQIADRLQSKVAFVKDKGSVGMQMRESGIQPVLIPSDGSELAFSLERREVAEGNVMMLFNASDEERTQMLDILLPAKQIQLLDPKAGEIVMETTSSERFSIKVTIPAGRSVVLIVKDDIGH